jgi:hypothetical protein
VAKYLVIHSPGDHEELAIRKPSDMVGLAEAVGGESAAPRWLRAWSPDLHDDRIFTLWEAADAAEIQLALKKFGFLDHMDALALRVEEWGPEDILKAEATTAG